MIPENDCMNVITNVDSTPFTIIPDHFGQSFVQVVLPAGLTDDLNGCLLFVPLTHDNSPWGGCVVDVLYREMESQSGIRLMNPILRIDSGTVLAAEEKINAALNEMLPEVLRIVDAEKTAERIQNCYENDDSPNAWVQPGASVNSHHVQVTYTLRLFDTDHGMTDTLMQLAKATFDLHTGERIADGMEE